MASSNDLVATMESARTYLYQFACPVLMLIGTVSCIINFLVFSQKSLRKNPCSIYFIAYNVANFVFIYSLLLSFTLDVGYNIDPTIHNLVVCRLRLYAALLFNCLSPFYLILASIDRVLITSPNAVTRRRSTLRLAYKCIIIGTLFWSLLHIHVLIFGSILQAGPNYFVCYFQTGVYLAVVGYYLLLEEILALLLMIIFGLWAIKNIRSVQRVRIAPELSINRTGVETNSHSTSSKDRQLVLMLILEIIIYILFSFTYAFFLLYKQITQNYIKSAARLEIENVVTDLCVFATGIPYCTSFYTNLIVSKTFRKEVKKVLSWKRIFCLG